MGILILRISVITLGTHYHIRYKTKYCLNIISVSLRIKRITHNTFKSNYELDILKF